MVEADPERDDRAPDDRAPDDRARDDRDPVGRHPDGRSAEDRARAAIDAIANGANPTAESLTLANRFTDEQAARLGAWMRRRFRRRG